MSWATHHILALRSGQTVQFRPRGNSMTGRISSGQLCTIAPTRPEDLTVGDIVLCRAKGNDYLHLVKSIHNGRFLIGNNRGGTNGWIGFRGVFGKCIRVEA